MATVSCIKDLLGSDIIIEAEKRGITPETYLNIVASDVAPGCEGLYTILHWLARPTHLHER